MTNKYIDSKILELQEEIEHVTQRKCTITVHYHDLNTPIYDFIVKLISGHYSVSIDVLNSNMIRKDELKEPRCMIAGLLNKYTLDYIGVYKECTGKHENTIRNYLFCHDLLIGKDLNYSELFSKFDIEVNKKFNDGN